MAKKKLYKIGPSKDEPGKWAVFRISDDKEIMAWGTKGAATRQMNRLNKEGK